MAGDSVGVATGGRLSATASVGVAADGVGFAAVVLVAGLRVVGVEGAVPSRALTRSMAMVDGASVRAAGIL